MKSLLFAVFALLTVPAFAKPPTTRAAAASLDASPAMRRRVFDQVWRTVGTGYFDPGMNGINWNTVRRKYERRAVGATNEAGFYAILNAMLGELKQSHLAALSPSALDTDTEQHSGETGETGITGEWIENLPVVARVVMDSPGAQAGVKPGDVIVRVNDRAVLPELRKRIAAMPPRYAGEERVFVWATLKQLLAGSVGKPLKLALQDQAGTERTITVTPLRSKDKTETFGALPPLPIEIETRTLAGGVGYIRWNIFLLPLLNPIRDAIRGFAAQNAPGIVLDLRGNPGGVGAMASGVAGVLLTHETSLGTMRMRTATLRFPVYPQALLYSGKVVVLTDEGSISTSEILAAGLQELGRARIVGRTTAGMVLPSQIVTLPDGGRLQFVVADFRTPKGTLLEGRGVIPDIPVPLTRATLAASPSGDAILDAALAALQPATLQPKESTNP